MFWVSEYLGFFSKLQHQVSKLQNRMEHSGQKLTLICLVDLSILIYWTSPFPILGVTGLRFNFFSMLNRNSCKQTVLTLIRRRFLKRLMRRLVLRRLIWVYTVCLGTKNGTLGTYGLINVNYNFKVSSIFSSLSVVALTSHYIDFV